MLVLLADAATVQTMRVLFAIPHYFNERDRSSYGSTRRGGARVEHLTKCLQSLHECFGPHQALFSAYPAQAVHASNESFCADVEIVVCTTGTHHLLDRLHPGLCQHHNTQESPRQLGYACHEVLRDRMGRYDYYCYLEDDVRIGDALLFHKLRWFTEMVGDEALLQPNRYESSTSVKLRKLYVDGNLVDPTISRRFQDKTESHELQGIFAGLDLRFQRVDNPHAGCFFLNASQMQCWSEQEYFLDRASDFWGPLESAATLGIMRTFRVYKPARENAAFLEVEHLDPRYTAARSTEKVKPRPDKADSTIKQSTCKRVELLDALPPFDNQLIEGLGLRGLQCGCGWNLQPGWLNSDAATYIDANNNRTQNEKIARIDERHYYLQHDGTQPWPMTDGCFDWIYSEHFIEHLTLVEGVSWLKQMHRLLRSGGCLRISTPDLRRYVDGYRDPSNQFFAEHRKRLEALGVRTVPNRPAWMVNQIFQRWGHQWIYDFDELRVAAVGAGFPVSSVRECQFQEGLVPEMSQLDLRVRSDESLYVEMTRD